MVILPESARAVILAHVRAGWPREACGLLSGRDGADGTVWIEIAHPTPNVAAGGRPDRFEVDPAARIALMKGLRGGPSRVIGHFHSHPGHAAAPSETDRRAAFEADLIWLIVALRGPDDADPVATAWAVEGPVGENGAAGFRPLRLRTDATA
ncbi:Mov34/MPN/PAD-1 family protein [Rhodospira trueperi]|uniref:Proteasome lid subunit RPN8/RPN11, contains Jab1/MPN metalloenzyme (JAMM) motif n=1 Tax=Rhodospira trueperi TaxID=69960 RepID=A0A1G7EZA7_9PROT|nr:M67 family metallopeptidase [Rhodospira trueperi]SDE68992.1 Proteasome lid subunit RPN8/RPN11, contains Jab1/MPN metalloenzyme (JAMM) motif [Rhodospira trueperi]